MSISVAKLDKQEVVAVYTDAAPIYDLWARFSESRARRRALTLANIQNGESVLEIAVGTGLTFQELLRLNPDGKTIGVDLTATMLEHARVKVAHLGARNYQLLIGDAYHLDFPDKQFDVLLNSYMFDLLPEADFNMVLAEFKRVLKVNGRMVLVNMTRAEHLRERLWETIYHLNPKWLGGCRGVRLTPALQATGFQEIHRETMSQLGFPSEIITAKRPL